MSEETLEIKTTTDEPEDKVEAVSNLRVTEIESIQSQLDAAVFATGSQKQAITETFNWALHEFPYANASDIWYHGIYRQFIGDESQNSSRLQAWRAVSGPAFEEFIIEYYRERLPPFLSICKTTDPAVAEQLRRIGGPDMNPSDIGDIAIIGTFRGSAQVFGVATVLTSFKGRLEEYVSGGELLQEHGLFAPVITLDVYTTNSSIDNRGELSTDRVRRKPARIIEEDHSFSNLYSFNSRTDETDPLRETHSVKTVSAPSFFDIFAYDLLTFWNEYTKSIQQKDTLALD